MISINVPFNQLNKVEGALIGYLRPHYNKTKEKMTPDREVVIEELYE